MISHLYGLRRYGHPGAGSTMAFLALTGAQLLHTFSSRSDTHSVIEGGQPPNPWIGLSVAGGFAAQGLAAVVPGLRRLLGIVPVGVGDVAVSWGLAAVSFAIGEALKVVTHGLGSRPRGLSSDPARALPPPRTDAPIERRDR